MTVGYLVAQTSTEGLQGSDAAASWRDHVRTNHGNLEYTFGRAEGFRGATVVQRARGYQLVEFWSDPITYTRTVEQTRNDVDRRVRIVIPACGHLEISGSRGAVRTGPGSATVLSATAPFTLWHQRTARAWILSVPEAAWPRALAAEDPYTVDLKPGLGSVAASVVRELSLQRDNLSEADFLDVASHATGLLAVCAGHHGANSDLARAACEYVRVHAHDATLTPPSLAAGLGWSLRQLQATLQADGITPSDLIRTTRLSNARAALQANIDPSRPISDIAFAQGFGSLSGFNAAFRREFGVTPREVRGRAHRDPV